MSDALGWISVPIVPTFSGVGKKLSDELVKPTKKAGQKASGELKKSNKEVVDSLDRQVKASSGKLKKFENDYSDAMKKRESQQHKVNAAMEEQTAAEEKYQDALKKGGSASSEKAKLERATAKVVDETLKHEKAERDVIKAEEAHAKQLEDLEKTTERYEEAQKNLGDELDESSSSLSGLQDKFAGLGDSMKDGLNKITTGAFLGIGAKIGTALMSGVKDVVSEGWETALNIDQVSRSLGAMTSETKVAEDMMVDLRKVASDKPVDYTAFLGAANTLAYMGYEGDAAVKVLDNIATAATGAGNDGSEALESAADALGKMQSNGKVTMDEIGTISNQGVPMLDMLIEHFGMTAGSYGELQEKISSGGVELEDVFQALGGTGADSFQMLSDSADNMNQSIGSQMQILKDNLNVAVGEALQPVLEEVDFEQVSEAIGSIAEKLIELLPMVIDIGLWVIDNLHWIAPLAGVLAAIAASIWLVNLAMAANPTVLIVAGIAAAIAGLVAALTWFFTQTEIGQEIWATFTEALGAAWDWVVEKLAEGWEWMRDNVFDPLWTFVQETVWPALQTAFEWIGNAWQGLSDRLTAVWDWIRDNIFDPFWRVLSETVWPFVQSVLENIQRGWQGLSDALSATWQWIRENVVDRMIRGFHNMWNAVMNVVDWIVNKWNWMGDLLSATWAWIRENVVDRMIRGFQRIWDNVMSVVDWIVDKWNWMRDNLGEAWRWIDENVFESMRSGLERVKGWFRSGVDSIVEIWNGLKEKLATPINWVIDKVYNNGIKSVFDGVAKKIGLDARLPEVPAIAFARGGVLPGYTPGRDPYTFVEPRTGMRIGLSGGEAILRPEATRVLGEDWVNNINAAARMGGRTGVENQLRHSHFANGGILDLGNFAAGGFTNLAGPLNNIHRSHASFISHFFPELFSLTSASRFTDSGYHSTGQATDWQAADGQFQTQMPTPASKGLARAIHRVFPDSLELIHWPLDGWQNLSGGKPYDFGPGTNAAHGNHIHWATAGPIEFDASQSLDDIGVGFTGGGAVADPEASWGFWGKILEAIPSFDLSGYAEVAKWPGAALRTMGGWIKDWAVEQLKAWADRFLNFFGGASARPATEWADLASQALARMGYDDRYLDIMLQQIGIESGGDPNAVNNWDSNAARGTPSGGLLQVIEPTYRDVRRLYPEAFEGLPDDRFHPLTNLTAGVGAVKRDWGGPSGRWPTRDGYADGGILPMDLLSVFDTGGILRHGEAALNLSGADEIVINNDQLQALSKLANNVGALVRQLVRTGDVNAFAKAMGDEFRPHIREIQDQIDKIADPHSVEGITARTTARRVMGLGIDIPGSEVVTSLLDAEVSLLDARSQHIGHIKSIAEAQEAYDEALRAHRAALDAEVEGISEDDRKAIDDAQKRVDEAEDDEARKKAEENLKKARERADEAALKSEEDRTKAIKDASAEVQKAEKELADARTAQVQDLDHLIVLSQAQVEGLIPQAASLAGQIERMGVPTELVSQGLGAVTSGLMAISGAVGPAGVSLGMALSIVQTVISVFTVIKDFVESIFAAFRKAQQDAASALSQVSGEIARIAQMAAEIRHDDATRRQELIRLMNEWRVAQFEHSLTVRDSFREIGEAERTVFEERMKLNEMFEKAQVASQIKARGLMEDISSAFYFQLDEANRSTVEMTDEMWEQYWLYESARASYEATKLQNDLALLKSEFAIERARRASLRMQEDINVQLGRSAQMLARANGVDLEDSVLSSMLTDTLSDLVSARGALDEIRGPLGIGGLLFRQDEIRGLENEISYLESQVREIGREAGYNISDAQLREIMDRVGRAVLGGGNAEVALRGALSDVLPGVVEALNAADTYSRWQPYYDAQDTQVSRDRELEDLKFDLDEFEQTFPLEKAIAGWESVAAGFTALSGSYGAGLSPEERESLRKEFANEIGWAVANTGIRPALDEAISNARSQIPETVQVVVEGGKYYNDDDVVDIVRGTLDSLGVSVDVEKVTSSQVATSRRTRV